MRINEFQNQFESIVRNFRQLVNTSITKAAGEKLVEGSFQRLDLTDMDELTKAKLGVFLKQQFLSYYMFLNNDEIERVTKFHMMDVVAELFYRLNSYKQMKKEIKSLSEDIEFYYGITDEELNDAYEAFKAGKYPLTCRSEEDKRQYDKDLQIVERAFEDKKQNEGNGSLSSIIN